MTFRPIFGRPSMKALLLGLLTMVVLYVVSTAILNAIFDRPTRDENGGALDVALTFVPIATFLVSGFVAGFVARQSPLMHGAILGLVVTSPFVVIPLVFVLIPQSVLGHPFEGYFDDFSILKLLQFACWSAFVCTLGAIFGAFFSNRRES